jgi:hypothetical protein
LSAGYRGRVLFGVMISGVEFRGCDGASCTFAQIGSWVKRRMGIALMELLLTNPSLHLAVRGVAAKRPLSPEPQAKCGS